MDHLTAKPARMRIGFHEVIEGGNRRKREVFIPMVGKIMVITVNQISDVERHPQDSLVPFTSWTQSVTAIACLGKHFGGQIM